MSPPAPAGSAPASGPPPPPPAVPHRGPPWPAHPGPTFVPDEAPPGNPSAGRRFLLNNPANHRRRPSGCSSSARKAPTTPPNHPIDYSAASPSATTLCAPDRWSAGQHTAGRRRCGNGVPRPQSPSEIPHPPAATPSPSPNPRWTAPATSSAPTQRPSDSPSSSRPTRAGRESTPCAQSPRPMPPASQ